MNAKLQQVAALIQPLVEKAGYIFVDVDYQKVYGQNTLTVTIDTPLGITLNDCEKVSKLLDGPLDELDFTNSVGYNLNVSSPGLDRPLKKPVDYERNLNKEIEVKLFKPLSDGKKMVAGILKAYDAQTITLQNDQEIVTLSVQDIAKASPVIHF